MQATPRPAHQPSSTSWQASKADPFPPIDTTDHRSFIMGITTIKLSQLRLSPLNQRRVKPSAVEAMADDIAAHGLLQNLFAYEDEGLFYVFAGGRRYRGIKELAKRKRLKNSTPFPFDDRPQEGALQLSLAEHFQHMSLHPGRETEARGKRGVR